MSLQKKQNYQTAILIILIAALIGGGIPVFTKIALREISPLSFTFLRFFIASIFILPFFLKEKPKIDKKFFNVIPLTLLATINVVLYAFGIRTTGATVSQVLYVAVPMIVAVFSFFLLKEKFNSRKITGIIIGFTGAFLVIFLPLITKGTAGHMSFIGNSIILIGVTTWSLYTVGSKSIHKNYSPIYLNSMFILLTALVMLPFAITELYFNPYWWHALSKQAIIGTLYAGIIGTSFYYLLYQFAIKHSTPVIATMIQYIQPIITYIWAYFLLGERLTFPLLFGAILVLSGAWLTTRTNKQSNSV